MEVTVLRGATAWCMTSLRTREHETHDLLPLHTQPQRDATRKASRHTAGMPIAAHAVAVRVWAAERRGNSSADHGAAVRQRVSGDSDIYESAQARAVKRARAPT